MRKHLYPLKDASKVAKGLAAELAEACVRLEVAGSIRRQRAFVHDIDIVVVPRFEEQPEEGLFANVRSVNILERRLLEMARAGTIRIVSGGSKSRRLLAERSEIPIDIYIASSETWGTLLLIRTGSREHNIRLCSLARHHGLELKADGTGLMRDGQIIASDSEESIFRALDLEFVPPPRREIPRFGGKDS